MTKVSNRIGYLIMEKKISECKEKAIELKEKAESEKYLYI